MLLSPPTGPIPVFVIARNRVTWLSRIVEKLRTFEGVNPVVIDNASSYPPLLAWYRKAPCKIIRLRENLGHMAPWRSGFAGSVVHGLYGVTDHDLDLDALPEDTFAAMAEALQKRPDVTKAGVSIDLDRVRDEYRAHVEKNEQINWMVKDAHGYFEAPIDTTLALYRAQDRGRNHHHAVRLPPPYVARHLPWEIAKKDLTDEDRYYYETADESSTTATYLRSLP